MKHLSLALIFALSIALISCDEDSAASPENLSEVPVDTVYVDKVDTLIDTLVVDSVDTVIVDRYHDVIERDTLFTDPECTTSEIDGLVTVTCGSKHTLVYKGSCDSVSFDPTQNFCYEGNVLDFCDGYAYNPAKYFCDNDSLVMLCNGSSYDLNKLFCAEDSLVALCNGKNYDVSNQFCLDDSIYDFCEGRRYNLDSLFCYNDSLIELCSGLSYDPTVKYCQNDRVLVDLGYLLDERDDQTYRTVVIGTQTWMAENLNYAYLEPTETMDSSSLCFYNEADSCSIYGRLYLWSAAMDSAALFSNTGKGCGRGDTCHTEGPVRGVCPEGWHLPSAAEWDTLDAFAGSRENGVDRNSVGIKLKATTGWTNNGHSADVYGFSAIAAGNYDGIETTYDRLVRTDFWSSTEADKAGAYARYLYYDIDQMPQTTDSKNKGLSVRCLKD